MGIVRGGMVDRSIDIGVRDSLEDGREERGELSVDMFAVFLWNPDKCFCFENSFEGI